jgi:nucleoside-diphosphate-sugar epimerase
MSSDLETLPLVDWVIDAAAQPSVLAGRDGKTSPRQLLEHNLLGTINLLEFCRSVHAGFILLSTSRVYSISALTQLPLCAESSAYALDSSKPWPAGVSLDGIDEGFSTAEQEIQQQLHAYRYVERVTLLRRLAPLALLDSKLEWRNIAGLRGLTALD